MEIKKTILEEGIVKLCQENTDNYISGLLKYINQNDTHYLVFVKPVSKKNLGNQNLKKNVSLSKKI